MFEMSSAISNLTNPPRLLFQENVSHCHHRNNLNLISPGLFIQHLSATKTFLSEYIGMASHGYN